MDTSVLSHKPLLYRHQKTIDTSPQNASSSILIYLLHWLHIIFLNYEAALLFTNLDNLWTAYRYTPMGAGWWPTLS